MSQISKERFCEIIDRLNNDSAAADIINMTLKKSDISFDFFDSYCLFERNVDWVCYLLETMFDDEDGWIGYWLFECMGNSDKFMAWDGNENQFYVRNSADLYELVANGVMNYE